VILKRRSEKSEPNRKPEGLKRSVRPPQCLQRLAGLFSDVVLVIIAVGPSIVATADVDSGTGSAESRVIAFSPQNRYEATW